MRVRKEKNEKNVEIGGGNIIKKGLLTKTVAGCQMLDVGYGMTDAGCGMRDAGCGMQATRNSGTGILHRHETSFYLCTVLTLRNLHLAFMEEAGSEISAM